MLPNELRKLASHTHTGRNTDRHTHTHSELEQNVPKLSLKMSIITTWLCLVVRHFLCANERTSVYLLQSLCDAQWTRFPFSFVLHVACQQLMDCLNCLSPACPRLSVSLSPLSLSLSRLQLPPLFSYSRHDFTHFARLFFYSLFIKAILLCSLRSLVTSKWYGSFHDATANSNTTVDWTYKLAVGKLSQLAEPSSFSSSRFRYQAKVL